MKVFLSWSGPASEKVAKYLHTWLPQVIQSLEPYMSSVDIEKGQRGLHSISRELQEAQFGILCITKDNMRSPWINFEAGALSKFIAESKVSPLLFNMKDSDLDGPLAQFQYTRFEKGDFKKLIDSLNSSVERPLQTSALESIFEKFWPDLERDLNELLLNESFSTNTECAQDSSVPESNEILEEILNLLRKQNLLLSSPEQLMPSAYIDKYVEQILKIENSVTTVNVIRDMISFTEQAALYMVGLRENSSELDISVLENRINGIAAAARYLERRLPQKSHLN